MKKLWDIFSLVSRYKPQLYANIFFNLLNAVLSLFTFLAVVPFLRILFRNNETSPEAPDPTESSGGNYYMELVSYRLDLYIQENGAGTALMWMCIAIVVVALLKNFVLYLSLFGLATIRTGVARDLRSKIYQKVLRLPMSFYSGEKKGDIISRMTNDLMEIEFSVIGVLEVLFKSPILIVFYLGTLFIMSWKLTLFAIIFLPISGYLISVVAKSLKNAARRGKSKLGELMSVMDETLTGMRIIKAFNGEPEFNRKFEEHNESYFRLMVKLYKREYLSSPTSEFVGILVVTILLYAGGSLVLSDAESLNGEFFIGYLVVFSQIIPPAKAFSDAIFKINKGGASIDRINDILDADEKVTDAPDAKSVEDFKESIEFRNVRFRYDDEEVLKGINFKVSKGQTVALVGPSGGGKSTLASLLPRYYDVIEGQIMVDGQDIRQLKTSDLRHLLGIVTQDSILFNDSVANNITLGAEHRERDAVVKAAQIANAEEFIKDLPGTYDFNIGDGGNKLSGGQKQRLSIARAVYKNPPILVLDEATSALDTRSEKLVQQAITKLMEGRTSLVIAHRLSTIQHADKIIVVKDGEIVEQGTHQDLMDTDGTYKALVELQNFD